MLKIHVCLCLILCFIRENSVDAKCNGRGIPADVAPLISLKVFKGDSTNMTVIGSPLTDLENVRDAISPEQDSILYIHGYLENVDAQNVQIPIAAYLDRGDVNVISLDWGTVAINFSYIYSADHVPAVGKAAVVALEKLSDVINLKTLHVIGHSLGAHVAGFIGRSMESTLSRITGLDPALPLFYPTECHLTEDDADFVVILHTDAGVFGTPLNTGSVDFYANRGVQPQPGCPLKILGSVVCSHQRSAHIYARAIRHPHAFLAHKCFIPYLDTGYGIGEVYFGDDVPTKTRGMYCFNTDANFSL
ncbi:PREDICTED: lipase member H-like [Eufriesea mexicana]|uniref:lipase member H-like n=1 Tax=Eufriesea mexicana TaxID=516756 RepID=UPI00083BF855|nr:PREDICTED: lipase member H-like [Eufriesea mexicana]